MKRCIYYCMLTFVIVVVSFSISNVYGATLVGYWPFDEGEGGIAHDGSSYENHGTIHGASWVEGIQGYALSFNGESTYVQVPNSSQYNMNQSLSVEAWILMIRGQTSSQVDVFDKSHRGIDEPPYFTGYVLQGYGSINFAACDSVHHTCREASSVMALNDSAWHFVVGTVTTQDNLIRFYLDGHMTDEVPFEGPIGTNNGDIFIGRHYLLGRYFSGLIDEVKVYDGALTPEEVLAHYEEYMGLSGTTLVGYWAFDEGYGLYAADSARGNSGTIHDATWIDGIRGFALSFDGVSAYVQVPNKSQYNNPMTWAVSVAAWVLMTPWQSYDQPNVFDKSHRGMDQPPYVSGYVIQGALAERCALAFGACNGYSCPNAHSGIPLNDSVWHFVAGTASTQDSVIRFYLDGKMTMELPFEGPIHANAGDIFIGRHYLVGRYFSGLIDEVKVYSGALTPEEVREHFEQSFTRGDANGDGVINSADVSYLINYLFVSGPAPQPWQAGDANSDGTINSADVAYLINYLFVGGPSPGC